MGEMTPEVDLCVGACMILCVLVCYMQVGA